MVSWTDADGNYYYKEVDLSEDLAALKANLDADLGLGGESESLTPVGKQWAYDWTEYAVLMGVDSMPACIDLGVSTPDYFMAGINYEALYGEEAAGMWMAGFEAYFDVETVSETSGKIWLSQYDFVTGEIVRTETYIEYFDLTETTCTFNAPDLMLTNVQTTLMEETVTVLSQGIAM